MRNKFLVFAGIYLSVLFWAAIGGYLMFTGQSKVVLFLVIGSFVVRGVCEIIYFFYKKPRPYQVLKITPPHSNFFGSFYNQRADSFPSGHASVLFFAAFYMLSAGLAGIGFLGLLVAALTSWSRVVLLYHYKKDILGGIILAVLGLVGIKFFI